MTDATARYVIAADDRTKAAIASVNRNFESMHKNVQGIVKSLNAALGIFIGTNVKQAFQSVMRATEEAAGPASDFAKSLKEVREAAGSLLVARDGLPGIASAMSELAQVMRDPAVQEMFDKMTSFMLTAAAKGGRAVAEFAGGTAVVLKRMGLMNGSSLQDEIDKLDREIAAEERKLQDGSRGGADFRSETRSAARKRIAELQARQQRLLYSPSLGSLAEIPGAMAPPALDIPTLTTAEREAAREARKAADEAKNKAAGRDFSFTSELDKRTTDAISDRVGEVLQQYQELQDKISQNWMEVSAKAREATDGMSVYAEQAARNMQDAFAQFLFDPFKGGVGGMLKSFADAIRQMVAQAAAARVFDALRSSGGGLGSFFRSILPAGSASTAGVAARADGGPVSAGRAYLVGERGPELFMPKGAGTIVPNGGGGGVTLAPTYNFSGLGMTTEQAQLLMQRNNRDLMEILAREFPRTRF